MKNRKRILSVTIKHMVDESPDTSWLGEYSNRPKTEYAIDRAHSEDCASVIPVNKEAQQMLIHARGTVAELQSGEHYEENGENLEWEALEEAYNLLDGLAEGLQDCDCGERGDMGRNEFRYFNPGSVEKFNPDTEWLAKYSSAARENTWKLAMRKNARQDYDRMESLNAGNWCFIGIRAEAKIGIPSYEQSSYLGTGYLTQKVSSGGLRGIESDSDKSYLESVEKDELSELREQLKALGFSSRAISTLKTRKEKVWEYQSN